jgi:hypothetical protein
MRRFGAKDIRLPARLRGEMRDDVGKIVQTDELAEALAGAKIVVSVGDVCTESVLSVGITPKLAIVDGQTKRGAYERPSPKGMREVRVVNPAEKITKELWRAVEDAYSRPESTLIIVDGEEDLASLACIMLAPEGTTLIYGVPNRGVTVIPVGAAIRSRTGAVLAAMEEC